MIFCYKEIIDVLDVLLFFLGFWEDFFFGNWVKYLVFCCFMLIVNYWKYMFNVWFKVFSGLDNMWGFFDFEIVW